MYCVYIKGFANSYHVIMVGKVKVNLMFIP